MAIIIAMAATRTKVVPSNSGILTCPTAEQLPKAEAISTVTATMYRIAMTTNTFRTITSKARKNLTTFDIGHIVHKYANRSATIGR